MRFFLILSVLLLNACSQPTPRQQDAAPSTIAAPSGTPSHLERQAEQAKAQGDLYRLTHILTQLWAQSDADTQLLIEYTLHDAWKHATRSQRDAAWQAEDPILAAWALLSELEHAKDPGALDKVAALYPEALFNHHLATYLKKHTPSPDTIAVFLPLSGRFASIGEQIRLGMLQTLFENDQPITLLFYDSATDAANLRSRYQEALQAGADAILGPLRPDAIETISQISQLPTLFLNTPSNRFGQRFPYPTPSEAAQIHARLFTQDMKRIGLLYRETPRATKLAVALQTLWQNNTQPHAEPYHATARAISNRHRDIRRQFDLLLQISQSKARAHHLKQVIGHRLHFEPRPRQDLNALVILSGRDQAAILNPLVKFYGLDLAVYGSSLLMPNPFSTHTQDKDLAHILFPSFPVALNAARQTPLQAWGSDALRLLLTPPEHNSCLNGLTGHLHLGPERTWDRRLKWLKYNASGQLTQADTP